MKLEKIVYKVFNFFGVDHFENDFKEILINLNSLNRKNINVIDAGCYLGVFSKNLNKLMIEKKFIGNFYLFDANPNIKPQLSNNNFKFYNYGLGATKGTLKLNINPFFAPSGTGFETNFMNDSLWNFTRGLILGKINTKYHHKEVKVNSVDNFCKSNKLKCDILKIDVEGFEKSVIEGAKDSLKDIKVVFLEISDNEKDFSKKFDFIDTFLKKFGFNLLKTKQIKSVSLLSKLKAIDCIYTKF